MKLQITTERLTITPFTLQWLEAYRQNFTPEVTRYQYPDPFPDPGTAQQVLSGFIADMERGDMLELVILGHKGEFLGSAEVFGLREKSPELGIWLKGSARGQGYGKRYLRGSLGILMGFGGTNTISMRPTRGTHPVYVLWRNFPTKEAGSRGS